MPRARWIILGEDLHHLNFVYHWLTARHVPRGAIFKRPVAVGRRAGDQYVRMQLPGEIRNLRRRTGEAIVLVVVTDADTLTVDQRIAALTEEVATELASEPRVAILVPRRNIETWIAHLHDEAVDEVTDYKPRSHDQCRAAARRLAALSDLPERAPDSFVRALAELSRVLLVT